MENNRDQMNEKNNEIITSMKENAQERYQSTGRVNIEDIYRRKVEERRQEKKSSYIVAGIVVVVFIVIALYFFSQLKFLTFKYLVSNKKLKGQYEKKEKQEER